MLRIRLVGDIEVLCDGERIALPPSRKTRALLAYLILKGTPQRREALCELFWEIPDDPRAALRWSLSRLRQIVNEEGAERLSADRERVAFAPLGAEIDILELKKAVDCGRQSLSEGQLRRLLEAAHVRLVGLTVQWGWQAKPDVRWKQARKFSIALVPTTTARWQWRRNQGRPPRSRQNNRIPGVSRVARLAALFPHPLDFTPSVVGDDQQLEGHADRVLPTNEAACVDFTAKVDQ